MAVKTERENRVKIRRADPSFTRPTECSVSLSYLSVVVQGRGDDVDAAANFRPEAGRHSQHSTRGAGDSDVDGGFRAGFEERQQDRVGDRP